jgi:hypothetical protein
MEFDREIVINRPPSAVYGMLAEVQRFAVGPGSPVLEMEKAPPGTTAVGTTWREVIELAPHVRMTVWSRVTTTDPGRTLAIAFRGPGMRGRLRYTIEPNLSATATRDPPHRRTAPALRADREPHAHPSARRPAARRARRGGTIVRADRAVR